MIGDLKNNRYFIPNLSGKFHENYTFFERLTSLYENENIMHCLYCYIIENININNFIPQRDAPITNEKTNMIYEELSNEYVFIKETYLSTKKTLIKHLNYFITIIAVIVVI
jgi:hypothetical protein